MDRRHAPASSCGGPSTDLCELSPCPGKSSAISSVGLVENDSISSGASRLYDAALSSHPCRQRILRAAGDVDDDVAVASSSKFAHRLTASFTPSEQEYVRSDTDVADIVMERTGVTLIIASWRVSSALYLIIASGQSGT